MLDAASTTSTTITTNEKALDSLLLSTIGFARSGIDLLGPNTGNLIRAINTAQPTTSLLMKYNPELTCLLVGGKNVLDKGSVDANGGANGKSEIQDVALLLGDDAYKYPDNLPITGAKGGPGGKPGCGSLPDVFEQLAGPSAGHQHRLGHRSGHPAQPRHRLPRLCRLPSGHPGRPRATQHPPRGRAGARADSLPGCTALRRPAVRAGRHTALPGTATSTPARRTQRPRRHTRVRAIRGALPRAATTDTDTPAPGGGRTIAVILVRQFRHGGPQTGEELTHARQPVGR